MRSSWFSAAEGSPESAAQSAAAAFGSEMPASHEVDLNHLLLISLLPVLLLLFQRLLKQPTADLLPTPLALAVAAVTPAMMLHPTFGMSCSAALNVLLLVHLQEAHLRSSTLARPDAAEAEATARRRRVRGAKPASREQPGQPPEERSPGQPVPVPTLTRAESESLARGQLVLRGSKATTSGGVQEGLAVQLVNAPVETVWATLLDFEQWPRMVDDVTKTAFYAGGSASSGPDIKVAVTLGIGFIKILTHVHHVLDKDAGQLTWTLDPSHSNDLLANSGYWLVRPNPSDQSGGSSIIFYSAAVRLKAWAPAWLDTFVAVKGLPRAASWLKREAEKRAAAGGSMGRRIQSAPNLAGIEDAVTMPPNRPANGAAGARGPARPSRDGGMRSAPSAAPMGLVGVCGTYTPLSSGPLPPIRQSAAEGTAELLGAGRREEGDLAAATASEPSSTPGKQLRAGGRAGGHQRSSSNGQSLETSLYALRGEVTQRPQEAGAPASATRMAVARGDEVLIDTSGRTAGPPTPHKREGGGQRGGGGGSAAAGRSAAPLRHPLRSGFTTNAEAFTW